MENALEVQCNKEILLDVVEVLCSQMMYNAA